MAGFVKLFLFASVLCIARGTILSKSSKKECIVENDVKNKNNTICKSKLVVSLTVNADEGKSQFIQANISRVIDTTKKKLKNIELKNPLRIRITKSPVVINFKLYQVGYVSNWPREEIKNTHRGTKFKCWDVWYTSDDDVNCGFAKTKKGKKIFDSQGFCCRCDVRYRGGSERCSGFTDRLSKEEFKNELQRRQLHVGHCLVHDGLKYFVMGLHPPEFQFTITVLLEQRAYLTKNGSGVWRTVSKLDIGPRKRIAVSDSHFVKVEYVADFHPSTFIRSQKLMHRYLLVPDLKTLPSTKPFADVSTSEWNSFKKSVRNMSEWMAIDKPYFDMSGFSCNKIGVSYTAFRRQSNSCSNRYGSCLHNQPYLLWKEDKLSQKERRPGRFMLHNFGKTHSLPHTKGRTDFQANFIADRPTTSLLVITMAADDLKLTTRVAPGRIVSAYIESFEALSTTGTLLTIVQNTGTYTSSYNVIVEHCSAGVDLVPSKMITLNPNESKNVSFIMHSFHAVGRINYCEVNLYDTNSKLLDNLTVTFETLDTCFCYGFCGCACGNNKTVCPDAPKRPDSDLTLYQPKWYDRLKEGIKKFGALFKLHGGKILIMFWVVFVLCLLGGLKVLHIIITQEVKMDAIVNPAKEVARILKEWADHILKEWCPAFCDNFWTSCGTCCRFCSRKCCWFLTCGTVSKMEKALQRRRIERGWRAPPYCDGMCDGARYRRSMHRKLMRMMKRTGQKKDTPWYSKKYNCTCKVKDQMPCVTICNGLFFFFYCPLLPVYWILEFFFLFLRRKWRRRKRIQAFRAERAEKEAKKQQQYLHIDEYSRGLVENEIVNLDKDIKELRQLEREYEAELLGGNPELEEELQLEETSDREGKNISSEAELSDTSDPDQANDVEELLVPGFPVYFNYAMPKATHTLQNPGKRYSIKGRITEKENKKGAICYHFDLHKYKHQVSHIVKGKVKPLKPPAALDVENFKHTFKDPARALKLVTFRALFPVLNGVSKKPRPLKDKNV